MVRIKYLLISLLLALSYCFYQDRHPDLSKDIAEKTQSSTIMVVNFIRHGNRTPGKFFEEIKPLFGNMDSKKLTLTGFKQMNLLGKYLRKVYIDSGKLQLDQNNISHEYLIISSPSQRSIDSSIAYSLGLFPDKIFKFFDFNNKEVNRDASPPILHHDSKFFENDSSSYYNLVIDDKNKNTLFHAKKCVFGDKEYPKNKNFNHLTDEERSEIYDFMLENYPETLGNFEPTHFNDKFARSLYSSMRCVNKHYKNRFDIPSHLEYNLKRMFTVYNYFVKISNDEASKIMSSTFFDHLIKFFDNRIYIHSKGRNKFNPKPSRIDAGLREFLPTFQNEDYSKLKLVTYSGHDGNLTALIRNFLYEKQILEYFKNFEEYKSLLYVSFASNIDFNLEYFEGNYYVKIFVNGQEPFEKVRSYIEGEYLLYDKERGIEYSQFRQLIMTRIHEDIDKCEFKQ